MLSIFWEALTWNTAMSVVFNLDKCTAEKVPWLILVHNQHGESYFKSVVLKL